MWMALFFYALNSIPPPFYPHSMPITGIEKKCRLKKKQHEVLKMTRQDWQINIENLAERVAEIYGVKVVTSVFARYDATCFDDLSPVYYTQVFGDLMQMESDS